MSLSQTRAQTLSRAARAWVSDADHQLFLLLTALLLIPLWSFKYFPSQDGPVHLENASILSHYFSQNASFFRDFYQLNVGNASNWLGHAVMALFVNVFHYLAVEKILLSLYIIFLPVSFIYAARSTNKSGKSTAILIFPFVYNFLMAMGFYSFIWSLPFFLWSFGYWFRHKDRFTTKKVISLSLLSIALYLFHIVSLFMLYIGISIFTFYDVFIYNHHKSTSISAHIKVFSKKMGPFACAFVPSFLIMFPFFSDTHSDIAYYISLPGRIKWLGIQHVLMSYSMLELIPAFLLNLLFLIIAWAIFRNRRKHFKLERNDGLLLIIAGFLAVYFLMPDALFGGCFIIERLSLYPFFILMLFFSAQPHTRALRNTIRAGAVAITITLIGLHWFKYKELNVYIADYLSGVDRIEAYSTLLPLCFAPKGVTVDGQPLSRYVNPFLHVSSHIAAAKPVIEFDNYEAQTGHFPLLFRPAVDPFTHIADLGAMERVPPEVHFIDYEDDTGRTLDYVLLWGVREEQLGEPQTRAIFEQLEAGYALIHTSPETGLMKLYQRVETPGSSRQDENARIEGRQHPGN